LGRLRNLNGYSRDVPREDAMEDRRLAAIGPCSASPSSQSPARSSRRRSRSISARFPSFACQHHELIRLRLCQRPQKERGVTEWTATSATSKRPGIPRYRHGPEILSGLGRIRYASTRVMESAIVWTICRERILSIWEIFCAAISSTLKSNRLGRMGRNARLIHEGCCAG
jgi:hypothetical protein